MRDGSIFVDLIIVFLSISGYEGQEYSTTKRGVMPGGAMTGNNFPQYWKNPTSLTEISPLRINSSGLAHPKDMVPGKSKRIIGGNVARPHEYPYQVALKMKYSDGTGNLCGGTILSAQWILTAAHCFEDVVSVNVFLGAYNIEIQESNRKMFRTERKDWLIHDKYVEATRGYDIALVRLPQKINLERNMIFIEIDQGKETHSGKWGKCLGWGRTALGTQSGLLRYVDLQIISNDKCREYKAYTPFINDHHICTSGEGLVGSCSGDSGGPLIVSGIQVGIVSFGVSDCNKGAPSIYTRVSRFSGWILDKTGLPKKQKRSASRVLGPLKAFYIGMMLCVATLKYFL